MGTRQWLGLMEGLAVIGAFGVDVLIFVVIMYIVKKGDHIK